MENSCDLSEITLEEELAQLYQVVRQLGQGAFGRVFECRELQEGPTYAVKVIEKNSVKKSKIDCLREEAKIMSGISHPNVVRLHSVHETDLRFYLKMQLIPHGTLAKFMQERESRSQPFSEEEAARIMRSIFEGVSYLHSLNIIHRDLKPQNILVADPHDLTRLKITDFGLSTQLDSQFPRSITLQCGTLIFMAPEILYRYTYTKSVDIYSCSIIMYMLLQGGRHPIYTSKMSADEYKKRLLHSKFPVLNRDRQSQSEGERLAQNFLDRISKYEALERYNVIEALKHPWITRKFNDQVPLSIYESFLSFENAQRVVTSIRMSFILSCQSIDSREIPPVKFYDMAYLEKCQKYNQLAIEQRSGRAQKRQKKKISSSEHIKQVMGEIDKQHKKTEQVYNQKHPKIEKLNNMFSHLFEKRSKHSHKEHKQQESKLETLANIASFQETLPLGKPQQQADPQCKEKIEQQIEKSVRDFKDKVSHKSRRIFSRNNLKHDMKAGKPQTLPAIHSKTSMGDHANLSTNEHDSSFKSSDKAVQQQTASAGLRGRQLRNRTTLKLKQHRSTAQQKNNDRKPSVAVRRG